MVVPSSSSPFQRQPQYDTDVSEESSSVTERQKKNKKRANENEQPSPVSIVTRPGYHNPTTTSRDVFQLSTQTKLSGRKRVRCHRRTTDISTPDTAATALTATTTNNTCRDYWKEYAQFWIWEQDMLDGEYNTPDRLPLDVTDQDVVLGTPALQARHVGTLRFGDLLQRCVTTTAAGVVSSITANDTNTIPRTSKYVVNVVTKEWGGRFWGYRNNERDDRRAPLPYHRVLSATAAGEQVRDILKRMERMHLQMHDTKRITFHPSALPTHGHHNMINTVPRMVHNANDATGPTPTSLMMLSSLSSSSLSLGVSTIRGMLLQATATGTIRDNDVLLRMDPNFDLHHGTNTYRRILRDVLCDFMHGRAALYLARKVKRRVRHELMGGGGFYFLQRQGPCRMHDPDAISLQVIRDLEEMETLELDRQRTQENEDCHARRKDCTYSCYPRSTWCFRPTKYDVFVGLGRFYQRREATPPGNVRFLRMVRDRCPTFRREGLTLDDLAREVKLRTERNGGRVFCRDGTAWCNVSSVHGRAAPPTASMQRSRDVFAVSCIADAFEIMEQRMDIAKEKSNSIPR